MERKTFKRVVRDRRLTAEEVAADKEVRRKVKEEFPPGSPVPPGRGAISDALRAAIHASSKSVYQICKEAGISPIVISRFLSGERDIRLATADRLARALGIAVATH
jgi:transcriptional regulator with XRE-family HTH domain